MERKYDAEAWNEIGKSAEVTEVYNGSHLMALVKGILLFNSKGTTHLSRRLLPLSQQTWIRVVSKMEAAQEHSVSEQ